MNCNEAHELIHREVLGGITPQETLRLNEHFVVCTCCVEFRSRLQKLYSNFKCASQFQPDEKFWEGFHKRVTCECQRKEGMRDRLHRWKVGKLPSAFSHHSGAGLLRFGALAVIIVAAIWLLTETKTAARPRNQTDQFTVEYDSSGHPIYRSLPPK